MSMEWLNGQKKTPAVWRELAVVWNSRLVSWNWSRHV